MITQFKIFEIVDYDYVSDYDEVYNKYKNQLERLFSVSNYARSYSHMISVQEVIDPRDTRRKLIRALDALANKHEDMPDKKHGVEPM